MCFSLINSIVANGTRRRRLLLLFCLFRYRFLESFFCICVLTHADATDCDQHCEHYEHGHSYSAKDVCAHWRCIQCANTSNEHCRVAGEHFRSIRFH